MNDNVKIRCATEADITAMQALIARSAIQLSASFYTPEQAQALLTHVFGVDTQLIDDQTYFVIEEQGSMLACGGWSKRKTLFGGDQAKQGVDNLLDPAIDAARIRAFFVEPKAARRGLGSLLLEHCSTQAQAAGFRVLELAATMPGEPLYLACGFTVFERFDLGLPGGVVAPLSRMRKQLF
ncbi:N-acetyltransferase [Undibacterium sp. KW1]|uniref:GNAT family N-acetyltransferase n=1 Tax=Undibacterium sp. KW1 TaxID=2058624 RepID=UPI001331E882|nr:GNAT family N-acetyltransferase [Undibacterium sp. KW1]BBB63441.1 N-acetyltransferase [Undibacterium sp. KW1]